jgi:hypothetical protein
MFLSISLHPRATLKMSFNFDLPYSRNCYLNLEYEKVLEVVLCLVKLEMFVFINPVYKFYTEI